MVTLVAVGLRRARRRPGRPARLNVAEPVAGVAALSVAVTVTVKVPVVVGVPEIVPVEALIDSPAGRPVADHVYGGVPPEALLARLTAVPTVLTWSAGRATDTLRRRRRS